MFNQLRLSAWSTDIRNKVSVPLCVELWNGQRFHFSHEPARVTIRVPRAGALRYLLSPSLYNLGRAYVEGAIEVRGRARDMIAVVNALAASTGARGRLRSLLGRPAHTRELDAAAIRYHYDVSNDFYRAWLDPGMVYSCAYFEQGSETLADAQRKKIDHILTKLDVRPGQRLLDIGCGWGALAIEAARRYGARCVGITLSDNQARFARDMVERAGLQGQVEIRLQDYRDITGSFDRIASVGMFEHVGVRALPHYFGRIRELLTDDGLALNHGITSTSASSGAAPHGAGDFIDEYVFPHGELAHLGTVLKTMQEGGLEALDVENLRRHYARTCSLWTERFEGSADQIRHMVEPRLFRIWHVYLAGCAYAFAHDWISIYQVLCRKAGRDPAGIAWSRRYMYAPRRDGGLS
ncbi:cyclopropane-fatty-acyl-phospholipid synthase family protein [Massilia sp. PAMC28688]|uniref:SAM-dependent methyltransferase n=1 Tax=Massilia sp. PAMC28688 TaxID=2861283 RepID=UPI001C638F1C|nr:cyclopropane-fatty-acyl-phospholipid synthase family protein [Massilia sp. PAMC28688]QYF95702.1 cyclopropane-fatty-acyl-phospholipid synthase family protein [Massilia sp. PAMC28688]